MYDQAEERQAKHLEKKYDKLANQTRNQNVTEYLKGWLNGGILLPHEQKRKMEELVRLDKIESMYERYHKMRNKFSR